MLKVSLPKKPKYSILGENLGKIEIEACHPGFGTTIGNTLRRILLSSLTGAAATSIKIKGISHEFSTMPGVKEDLIQIILNLKKVRFKVHKDEPVKLTLKEKGAKKISAAQIQCPADVEVVNKDMPIAEITDKKAQMEMEIEVQKGLGYVPVEQQEREKKEIGLIAIDAIFTPVKRVNYVIENMRVGKRTDFDKITFEIETDGSITPEEAFQEAVKIAIDQFGATKEMDTGEKADETENVDAVLDEKKEQEISEVKKGDSMDLEVASIPFSTRTQNVLEKSNIKTIADLVSLKENELMNLEGMGEKGIKEIRKAIGNLGLTLRA
ncbi:MAG: DNA-directed RNA polymerase subunit alpha [Candidatus Moranbacteria bacterium RIFOXYB1_FULL_44_23]|nr:MAG: DNA-directed RNA polymerase subunit alpha [Candidatus Moranbacteria bacterium GW2011_GWF1_44_4]OGI24455.1 MAG: DNA-directed RNA polymerase subunit alpha [Candidatus Moranbacteria bacterium RIFOXYA1_FULL_44_8]OGI34592.1 MAG: DNA-directed RNA polymerase subunit alpha [Candidatus Moranbacteria bacterium RIFOXYC1_FULL_44_8]OGI39254.1 MAG: DNA-directed RNA polymerase subunit alpha [Candidatus Moranbacteria bacterium RIFOXYB1_FULL_44_23]OGI41770.1 MAG: DNA-directed RNA polymerase subunit alph